MNRRFNITGHVATNLLVAIVLLASCKKPQIEPIDFSQVPVQTINDVKVVQTNKSMDVMRMSSPVMKRFSYVRDSVQYEYELYCDGFMVDAYNENGELETTIRADEAKHNTLQDAESWCAYGNVVVTNHLKGESMTTDTIYWNREEKTIYTDCYVRLTSYSGMMQGFGMTSDERARNSTILQPFDSYSVSRDSGDVYIDTLNLMGPALR